MNTEFKDFKIGDLRIEIPIIQGGMGVQVSKAGLAAAVSNAGGLGVIASVGLAFGEETNDPLGDYVTRSRNALIRNIKQARKMTDKPLGVNIMCALTNYEDLVDAAQQESIEVIISGAGLPLKLPSLIKNKRTKLVPIVSSARAAKVICLVWKKKYGRYPDAIVVEGPLAGGHLGYALDELKDSAHVNLDQILTDVVAAVKEFETSGHKISVIAAGGIFDGEDIARVIRLGASAVQMATRFVCTHECDADYRYKEAYLKASQEDIVIIKSPVGMPGRVIMNEFVKKIVSGARIDFGCPYRCLSTCDNQKVNYCIANALYNAAIGHMDKGFAMCGSNAYRINKIVSVKELFAELVGEARAALNKERNR